MKRMFIAVCAVALVPFGTFPVIAQEDASGVGRAVGPPGQMTARDFANAVQMSDMFEIAAGQVAAEQGFSDSVKTFGKRMVSDHTQSSAHLKSELDHIVEGQRVSPPPQLDPRHMDMYQALQAAHGPEFDRIYIQQQLGAHREALDVLQGYAANGQLPPLRRFAAQTVPMVRDHLNMLRTMRGM